jgi:hypothetical protein
VHRQHPDVHIVCAAVDRGLNERGFIVPGLGGRRATRLYGNEVQSFPREDRAGSIDGMARRANRPPICPTPAG